MTLAAGVHLCLFSPASNAANLAPLLDENTRPERVVVLCSVAEAAAAEELLQTLAAVAGVSVQCELLADAGSVAAVRQDIREVLDNYAGQTVALNASGGGRLVSLAAAAVFQQLNQPVFYVDARTDDLVQITPLGAANYQLSQRMTVQQYLTMRGFEVQQAAEMTLFDAQRAFAQELVSNIRHYSEALSILNWLAASAGSGLQSRPIESWHMSSRAFIGLLDRLREVGLALVNRNCLVFPTESAKLFVNGGWLQDYLSLTLAALREEIPALQDFEQSLLLGQQGDVQHEVDAALLLNNRLHLIECRAKKFKKGNAKTGAEAVHRTDELMLLNQRLQAHTLLLSYRPLREVDVRRLQLIGIKVLQEKQLQNLRFYLQEWLQ